MAADQVTQVKAGSKITVTIHQVNADGAGPYACDLDETSNSGTITQNLTVTNNVPGSNGFSQAKAQAFDIEVQMPDNFTCTGASTGNVCTVRCRNNALAGPFGGCFAVQQVDTDEKTNVANSIQTEQSLDNVLNQVQQNQADFKVAVDANRNAGSDEAEQNLAAVNAILGNTIVTKSFAQQTPTVVTDGAQQTGGGNNAGATSAADDAATTPGAIATSAGGDIITTAITPGGAAATTPAAGDQTNDGTNNGDDTTDNNNNNQNGDNGQNGNNQNQNNGNQNNGNQNNGNQNQNQNNDNQNQNQNQNQNNNNGFGRFGNGNFGRAVNGLRWARRMVAEGQK